MSEPTTKAEREAQIDEYVREHVRERDLWRLP